MAAAALHPTENRGYRELYATTQRLASHWSRLAGRLGEGDAATALEAGVRAARQLLDELALQTARYGLHGFPAARGLGARMAGAKNEVGDRFLERNQALRLAVLDAYHVKLLLGYLAEVAGHRGDAPLAEFCRSWEGRIGRIELPVRRAALAAGSDPDTAIKPVDASAPGRAAHGLAYAIGTAGEWVDGRAASHRRSGAPG